MAFNIFLEIVMVEWYDKAYIKGSMAMFAAKCCHLIRWLGFR